MTEQGWKQLQELNKTPLSMACKALVRSPSEMGLYLVQALQQAQEENQPDWENHVNRRSQTVWRTTRDILEEIEWRYLPKTAYNLLVTNTNLEAEEMNDSVLLAEMQKEAEPREKLWTLLDWVTDNLQSNGFSLDGTDPVRD